MDGGDFRAYDRVVGRNRSLRQEIAGLAHEGLTWVEFSKAASAALRREIPFDRHCWRTIDPDTLLFTGALGENLGPEPRLPYYEYAIPDINQFAVLAHSRRPVATLREATGRRPQHSPRYRDLMAPRGIRDELRASFLDRGSCWGACSLFRGLGEPDFSEDEVNLVAGLTGELAVGFRRALLVASLDGGHSLDGPGIILFNADGSVDTVSPIAESWMSELVDIDGDTFRDGIPYVVSAVAERARRAVMDVHRPEAAAHCRAPTRRGRWVVIHGTPLDPSTSRAGSAGGNLLTRPVRVWSHPAPA